MKKIKTEKKCPKCNETKPIEAFEFTNREKGYRQTYCRVCKGRNLDIKRRRDPKKEYLRERQKQLRNMGTSIEEVNILYTQQEGKCKINGKYYDKLHVDHDHNTGKFRGLLSREMNTSLGFFEDNPNNLLKAVIYLLETKTDKNTDFLEINDLLSRISDLSLPQNEPILCN